MNACRVCGNHRDNRHHVIQEKYFGLGDEFDYLECGVCGSLSIVEIPEDMARYYQQAYYAHAQVRPYNHVFGYLRGKRDRYYLSGSDLIGRLLSYRLKAPPYVEWLKNLALPRGSRILDVGCGSGTLIVNLQDAGFQATGVDPYIDKPIVYPNGARVLKQSLPETSGRYDCIMLHHSLEHMAEPRDALSHVNRVLNPGGKVLVRVPVAGTHAWKTYHTNWFQLDAPRHFVIFSDKGMRRLAAEQGFEIVKMVYDSGSGQFWASEQYARGIALTDERSCAVHPANSMFTPEQMEEYGRLAVQLNASADGDQAAFYLERAV